MKPGCVPLARDAVREVGGWSEIRDCIDLKLKVIDEIIEDHSDEIHPDLSVSDRIAAVSTKNEMAMEFQERVSPGFTEDEFKVFSACVLEFLEEGPHGDEVDEGTWDHMLLTDVKEMI